MNLEQLSADQIAPEQFNLVGRCPSLVFDRTLQTCGDSAFGHHALAHRVRHGQ